MTDLPCQEKKTYADLIDDIVSQIVDKADDVDVTEVENGQSLRFNICVDASDKGKLIGREGRIIGALHTLLIAISRGKKVSIDISIPSTK